MDAGAGGGGRGCGSQKRKQACAICKQQKRGCSTNCPTAPYFPSPPSQDLADVQRLFGLGNLIRIHNSVPAGALRAAAMKTMIWEARMRRLDPVHGACGVVDRLTAMVKAAQGELESVRRRLALYRQKGQAEEPQKQHPHQQQNKTPQCRNSSTDGRNADEVLWQLVLMLGGAEDVTPGTAPSTADNADQHEDQAAAPPAADLLCSMDRVGKDPTNPPPTAPAKDRVNSNDEGR